MKKEQSYAVVVDVSNDTDKGTSLGDGGTVKKVELLPPDGGWGWAIALGMALSTMIAYPVMQTFAFVYKDKLANVGLTATDSSVIINTNAAFGMSLGLFHGSLLNRFSYRKVGITASIIFFIGVLLTSFCNSFISFLLSYGIITSLGLCLFMPAFSLAINSYFKAKRNIAMGFAMTFTGMGTVIMPPVISKLLSFYGVQGTGLIMAALSLHSLVGALLLQPIKWHLKKVVEPQPESQDTVDQEADHTDNKNSILNGEGKLSDSSQKRTRVPLNDESTSVSSRNKMLSNENGEWPSIGSFNRSSLGSNTKIFDEKLYIPLKEYDTNERGKKQENEGYNLISDDTKKTNEISLEKTTTNNMVSLEETPHSSEIKNNGYDEKFDEAEDKGCLQTFIGRVVNELDLTLFKDPHYTNLILGMSIAICAEANFSLMMPFILSDLKFTDDQIAIVMSSIGIVDIIFRCISPFFADHMKYTAKTMYLISMGMLILSRTAMIFFTDFKYILIVAIALGAAKGVRTVFMYLVLPSHVPIERLASANGLQIVTNGVFLMVFGPLVGFIRDVSGSYNLAIVAINALTALTITMWLTEIVIVKCRDKPKTSTES